MHTSNELQKFTGMWANKTKGLIRFLSGGDERHYIRPSPFSKAYREKRMSFCSNAKSVKGKLEREIETERNK